MTYEKQTWANDAAGGTPLSAARLNHMEDGIAAAAPLAVGEGIEFTTDETVDGGTVEIGVFSGDPGSYFEGQTFLGVDATVVKAVAALVGTVHTNTVSPPGPGRTTFGGSQFQISPDVAPLMGNEVGTQPDLPNALVRKDYVDGKFSSSPGAPGTAPIRDDDGRIQVGSGWEPNDAVNIQTLNNLRSRDSRFAGPVKAIQIPSNLYSADLRITQVEVRVPGGTTAKFGKIWPASIDDAMAGDPFAFADEWGETVNDYGSDPYNYSFDFNADNANVGGSIFAIDKGWILSLRVQHFDS